MAAGNPTFTTFLTAVLRNYQKGFESQLFAHQVLIFDLESRGFVDERKGGRSITEQLLYGQNSTVKSYSGYDPLDVTPQLGFTRAEFYWKYLAGTVTISGQEEHEASNDKFRTFNLLEGKVRQLEESMKLVMNQQVYADGTGNGGKDITGLAIAVEDGTAWSTYGGIDSSDADNSWWRNQFLDFDATYTGFRTGAGASIEGMAAMRSMYNNCSRGRTTPTLILTDQTVYELYEEYIEGQKQRVTDTRLADAGFMNVKFKQTPVVWDTDMDAGDMLFLNSNYLKFVIGKGRRFKVGNFVKPPNQDAKVAQVLWAGNFVMSRRDVHGRIIDIVA